MKKFIRIMRKTARFVLAESRRNVVNIELRRIDYGGILAGKKAVITGGGKGIGFAIAEKFVSEGAQVLIAGRDTRSLECAVGKLGGGNQAILFLTRPTWNVPTTL